MKHPWSVEGFDGTLDELAEAVGNMRYDKARDFLEYLADDLKRQADEDKAKGRTDLADKLYKTAETLYAARDSMDAVWKICEPQMEEE